MTFQILSLPADRFAHLHAMDDASLASHGARRVIADERPGFPCRVSLADAAPGEALILVQYQHQTADTPYRASHAVYVRSDVQEARPAIGEVPAFFLHRMLSLRAFDATGMLVKAELSPGAALAAALVHLFASPSVAEVHIHFAAPGCYAARAVRPG